MELNENNFVQFCANHYNNIHCSSLEEFNEDVKRFQHLKKLLSRYQKQPDIKTLRLILNHLIVIFNVFTVPNGLKLLFLKLSQWGHLLAPIFVYMQILPEQIKINSRLIINTSDFNLDSSMVDHLREFKKHENV